MVVVSRDDFRGDFRGGKRPHHGGLGCFNRTTQQAGQTPSRRLTMKYIERLIVAAAVVLLIGTLALTNDRSARTSAPTARLRPEQVATLPARIQAQVAGMLSMPAGRSRTA